MNSDTRNKLGFVLLGLCNNFSFNIMLSAANDLMAKVTQSDIEEVKMTTTTTLTPILNNEEYSETSISDELTCNELSTSAILIADIVPALCVQILYPIMLVKLEMGLKLSVILVLACSSYIITGQSSDLWSILLGTCSASIACGLGESTFVSSTSSYGSGALIGWSVGTGCAGLSSALAYAVMRMALPMKATMIMMLLVPFLMLITYMFVLVPVPVSINDVDGSKNQVVRESNGESIKEFDVRNKLEMKSDDDLLQSSSSSSSKRLSIIKKLNHQEKNENSKVAIEINIDINVGKESRWKCCLRAITFMVKLANYTMPMFIVYMCAYFINQGLIELCYFKDMRYLDPGAQYRWLQVVYQIGSLLSRSSICLFRFRKLWLMALLQPLNVVLLLLHATNTFELPSFYLAMCVVLFEGILTGLCYVNTYFNIRQEIVQEKHQRVSLSIAIVSNSLGILVAAISAIPVHDKLCRQLIRGFSK